MICDRTEHKKQNGLVFLFSSPLQSEIGPNSLGCAFYLHHQWSAPRLSLSSLATGFIFNIGPNLNIVIVQHILIVIYHYHPQKPAFNIYPNIINCTNPIVQRLSSRDQHCDCPTIDIVIPRDSDYAALQDFSQLMRDLRLGESKEHIYGE